jgi:glycosyltransferase involved in cell wall biosynthesis
VEAVAAISLVGAEIAQLARARRRAVVSRPVDDRRDAVLAIWPGALGANVGGAVTHMSGVLAAFRHLGFHVGLLALGPPPPQLAAVADDIEVAPAPSHAARLTGETTKVCSNRLVRDAGQRLLSRLRPRLVYQRHEAFATFGVDVAQAAQAPLVLEWNNSEVWAHRHWHVASPAKRAFTPLAATMERHVLSRARLVVAVSSHAAEMALEGGAAAEAVLVLPNGVDIEAIDRGRCGAVRAARDSTAVVGWVGSFESWHGADVLVRALALLDQNVHAVLVGDGLQRTECESLARELGVEQRIEWTGSLPHSEAIRRLAACDLLASPHVQMQERPFFGSPTKVFEYMATGRPIVASKLEQIGEILDHDQTAVLVAPGDAEDLARGIEDVLHRPDRGLELGLAARYEAETHHTWDARVREILASLGDSHSAGGADAVTALQSLHSD